MKLDNSYVIETLVDLGHFSRKEILEWIRTKQQSTIRDEFAAKILPTVYSDYCKDADVQGYVEGWRTGVAKDAYMMADAMLAERSKDNV